MSISLASVRVKRHKGLRPAEGLALIVSPLVEAKPN